jgi:hypothetical protein
LAGLRLVQAYSQGIPPRLQSWRERQSIRVKDYFAYLPPRGRIAASLRDIILLGLEPPLGVEKMGKNSITF